MMFRIDRVKTPAGSPLGDVGIGGAGIGLAGFDLIIVVGRNGAGKTSLTESLLVRSESHLNALSLVGGIGELDRTTDVAQDLVSRNSIELMTEFTSLSDALARAVGVGRLVGERKILDGVLRSLPDLIPTRAAGRPLDLQSKLLSYARAEDEAIRVLGPDPLSLSTFNSIGREVARMARTTWTEQTTTDRESMERAERQVRPEDADLPGRLELLQAQRGAQDLRSRGLSESHARNLREREAELQRVMGRTRPLLEGDTSGLTPEQFEARCREAIGTYHERRMSSDKAAAAMNSLANLREQARSMLEQDHSCNNCYVCRRAIDRTALLDALNGSDASAGDAERLSREAGEWAQKKTAVSQAYDALLEASRTVDRARASVGQAIEAARQGFVILERDLGTIRNAAPEVLAAIQAILGLLPRAVAALNQAAATLVVEDIESAGRIVDATLESMRNHEKDLEGRVRSLNEAVQAARGQWSKLSPLRHALVMAREINEIRWEPDWKQAEENKRMNEAIEPWEKAIEELIAEREAEEKSARDGILKDPEVRARFERLVKQVHEHPLLRDLALTEDRIVSYGQTLFGKDTGRKGSIKRVSEGYRVLLNLAAFIAVSGYVREGQQHKVGWILLDEPTNGLDPEHRRIVADYLGGLDRESMPRQIFVTTFEPEFAERLATRARETGARRCVTFHLEPFRGSPIPEPRFTIHH